MIPAFHARVPSLRLLAALLLTLGAGHVSAAPNGAHLFARNCAVCHGARGTGGVGVPLALPDLLSTVDDSFLRKTIRHGRPGRVMPAFRQLSDAEVDAIVAYVRGWAKSPVLPLPHVGHGDPARGAKLFAAHCAVCHGPDGEGGPGTGVTFSRPRNLPILAPALNNAGFLAAASDGIIKATLMRGRRGTPMPNFLKQGLTDAQLDDIVAYVRSFQKHAPVIDHAAVEAEPPILMRETKGTVAEIVDRLKIAIAAENMRLIRAEPADTGFVTPGRENAQVMIVDGCDFHFVDKALGIDPRVGLFLPCRITVVQRGDKVLVMSVNPKRLSAIFNNAELDQLCNRMYGIYSDILDEAAM
jgi:cytochrome c oxidase cbb3-type subunit 3